MNPAKDAAVLASYLPGYVRRRIASDGLPALPAVDPLAGAVLFADISGFTALSERLAERGPEGAETVTQMLNAYFGRLIDVIAGHGGEVLSFAGDAMLVLWPSNPEPTGLAEAVQRAAFCGADLAEVHREPGSGGATDLVVRLGVSAGALRALHLGGVGGQRYGVVVGAPLQRAFEASERVNGGQVGIDDSAWSLITGRAKARALGDGYHIVTSTPRPVPPGPFPGAQEPFGGPMSDLSPYIPLAVLSRETSGQREWLAELRRVTVVFVSLSDFHHAAVDAAHDVICRLQTEFGRHEATINKISVDSHGTSLVAATGLPPLSHEDDPTRAVRAALAVAERLNRLGWRGAIGVATGRAFCGPIGNPTRREYTMVGDVVNLAARLMQEASATGAPGQVTVLCDPATFRASGRRIEYERGPALIVKGKRSPVVAYRPAVRRSTLELARTPILGRDRERRVLLGALEDLEKGQAAPLVFEGEPGIGKSRLLSETRRLAEERGIRSLAGAGDVIERSAAYHAWRPLFSALLHLGATPGPTEVERARQSLPEDLRPLAPLLNVVLGLDLPDSERTSQLQGQSRVEATRELLLSLLGHAAAEPLALVVDDMQWLDSASWSLVFDVARRLPQTLLVLATRPPEAGQRSPEYAQLVDQAGARVLQLGPLEAGAIVELACSRLDVESLPDPVVELIVVNGEGNPLFSEELAYALRDAGIVSVDEGRCMLTAPARLNGFAVPDTVQGVIASRIDALEPRAQLALKVASVIGPTFPAELLHDVYPVAEHRAELGQCFETLIRRNLTVSQEPEAHRLYAFRHVLTRDVAYNLMLLAQRRDLHRGVAEWYETRFADNPAPVYATLAHHWSRADVVDKACQYLELASVQALNNGLVKEAVNLGLEAAAMLGVDFPRSPAEIGSAIGETLAAIERCMAGRPVDDLLSLPPVDDPAITAAIGILLRTQPAAHISNQLELFALMGLQNFLLTLQHGATPFTPGAVAIYAMLVRPLTGDSLRAFTLGRLANQLAERDAQAMRPYAGFVHSWFLHQWVEPIANTLADLRQQSKLGFEYGDVTFGCFNAAAYVIHLACSGAPLEDVVSAGSAAGEVIARRVHSAAFHCLLEKQVAKALAGRTVDHCSLTDREGEEGVNEEWDVAPVCETESYNQIAYYLTAKLRLHYHYREYEAALSFAERAERLRPSFAGQMYEAEFVLLHALSLLGRHPPGQDAANLEPARASLLQLRAWAEHCPANFRHKALLVEGELTRVQGHPASAASALEEAAESADDAGFVHYAALARELEARSRLDAGDAAGARAALGRALSDYRRWGAAAKVHDVAESLARLSTPDATPIRPPGQGPRPASRR